MPLVVLCTKELSPHPEFPPALSSVQSCQACVNIYLTWELSATQDSEGCAASCLLGQPRNWLEFYRVIIFLLWMVLALCPQGGPDVAQRILMLLPIPD